MAGAWTDAHEVGQADQPESHQEAIPSAGFRRVPSSEPDESLADPEGSRPLVRDDAGHSVRQTVARSSHCFEMGSIAISAPLRSDSRI